MGFFIYIHEPLAQPRPTQPQPNYAYQLAMQQTTATQQQQQRNQQTVTTQQSSFS